MTLAEITTELKARKINITESSLEKFLSDRNVSPADVTPAVIDAIAQELQPSALATAPKSGKVAKGKNKRSTRGQRIGSIAEELGSALSVAADATRQELDAIANTVHEGVEAYENATSENLVDRIRAVPENVLRKTGILAAQEVADVQMFRQTTGNVMAKLGFGLPDDAATDEVEAGSLVAGR